MNDNTLLKQNFGAAILYISAVLDDMNYSYEFHNSPTATFDGKTFRFPHLPLEVSQKAIDYIWGFVYHELGHAIYTDFEAVNFAIEIGGLTEGIYRILEDLWQERLYNKDLPYSFKKLHKLSEVMLSDDLLGPSNEKLPPLSIVRNFILNYGYSSYVKHTCLDVSADHDEQLMIETFNTALVTKLKTQINNLSNCDNSMDVLSIACLMVKAFNEEKDKLEPPSSQNNTGNDESSDDVSQGANSDCNGQSPDDVSQDANSNGNGQSQDDVSQDANSNGNSQSQDDVSQDANSSGNGQSQDDVSQDANQARIKHFNDVINASSNEFGNFDKSEIIQSSLAESISESGQPLIMDKPLEPLLHGLNRDFIRKGEQSASGLIPKFKRLFESKNKSQKRRVKIGSRLGRNAIVRAKTNNPRIFVNKTTTAAVNTHISFALDNSSSMRSTYGGNTSAIEILQQSISAIGIAISRTKGLSMSACAFPSNRNPDSVDIICRESDNFVTSTNSFTTVDASGGWTPMANGLIWSMEQAARSKYPRKIIIVITDGEPSTRHKILVKDMVAKCKTYGVEVWAIGIKLDTVDTYFDNNIVIDDVNELPYKMLNLLSHAIE